MYIPQIKDIGEALKNLNGVARKTPLEIQDRLSEEYEAEIWLKREDLQRVRSYKIRGAYNKMFSLTDEEKAKGIVCASAGNHAQGVALSCYKLGIKGTIFMPVTTPRQKVDKVKMFGKDKVEVVLVGDAFDDANYAARAFEKEHDSTFIHPFNDKKVIEGQATVALEILHQFPSNIDYVFVPIGGGGLSAGIVSVFKKISPLTKIIGVEPTGAPAMYESIKQGKVITLEKIEKFVDGAAVKRVGELNFEIVKELIDDVVVVHEGKVCETMLRLYNEDAIVVEPSGALTIAILDDYRAEIKGKNVVCLISGSNNDISRTAEIQERALLYKGLKHYFIVKFPQRAGALKEFVTDILGPNDDIVFFQYDKKTNLERGPAVVGIQLKYAKDFDALVARMKEYNFWGQYLNDTPELFRYVM